MSWPRALRRADRSQEIEAEIMALPGGVWGSLPALGKAIFSLQAHSKPREKSEVLQQASAVFLIQTLGRRAALFAGEWKPLSAGVTLIDFRAVE